MLSKKESCFKILLRHYPHTVNESKSNFLSAEKAPLLCGYYILILTHCQGNITQMLIKFSRLKIQYVVYYNIVTDRRKFL